MKRKFFEVVIVVAIVVFSTSVNAGSLDLTNKALNALTNRVEAVETAIKSDTSADGLEALVHQFEQLHTDVEKLNTVAADAKTASGVNNTAITNLAKRVDGLKHGLNEQLQQAVVKMQGEVQIIRDSIPSLPDFKPLTDQVANLEGEVTKVATTAADAHVGMKTNATAITNLAKKVEGLNITIQTQVQAAIKAKGCGKFFADPKSCLKYGADEAVRMAAIQAFQGINLRIVSGTKMEVTPGADGAEGTTTNETFVTQLGANQNLLAGLGGNGSGKLEMVRGPSYELPGSRIKIDFTGGGNDQFKPNPVLQQQLQEYEATNPALIWGLPTPLLTVIGFASGAGAGAALYPEDQLTGKEGAWWKTALMGAGAGAATGLIWSAIWRAVDKKAAKDHGNEGLNLFRPVPSIK